MWRIYFVEHNYDDQTGDMWEGEPIDLQLGFDSHVEALKVRTVFAPYYTHGHLEVDSLPDNTYNRQCAGFGEV